MAGCMALDGTAAAVERAPAPLERLPRELGEDALRLWEAQKKIYRQLSQETGTESLLVYRIEEESLFRALWQVALEWQTGFQVDLACIPLRQETVEICECLGLNPYWLRSGCCLLLAGENGGRLARRLRERGLAARVIGQLTAGRDKLLIHGQTTSCLNRPQADELERLAAGQTR